MLRKKSRRAQSWIRFVLLIGIILFINIIANVFYTQLDLTQEKRFTLTPHTRELARNLNERIYVQILLSGDLPPGLKRLRTSARQLLDDLRSESGYIDYRFDDPLEGPAQEINERMQALAEAGIRPIRIDIRDAGQNVKKQVYPYVIFRRGQRSVTVNLIENNSPAISPDVINNSERKLEYKFANAIKRLEAEKRKNILFTRDHGELSPLQTADLERSLHQFYDTDRLSLDSVIAIDPKLCELLIVAKPQTAFSEKDKFKIDQYLMQGGKILWLVDRLNADIDSIQARGVFVPSDYPLNIEDMLFKYGARIQPDLVLDMECTSIPLVAGMVGNAPDIQLFPWYYFPAVQGQSDHPVVKNLDRVELRFCSSIDTVRTRTAVVKTPLLYSSKYSRLQFSPISLNFQIAQLDPDPSKFNKGPQLTALLLEGEFASNYENRVSEEMARDLEQAGVKFSSRSAPTRMIVVSDGDVTANHVRDAERREWLPLGFNRFERIAYANKDFMLNAIEYLIEPRGVVLARSKEIKLRMLDTVRAREEKLFWQALNLGVPLAFLSAFGLFFHWRRRRMYAR